MLTFKRAVSTTLAIAASIGAMAFAANAQAADSYLGAAWGVRTTSDLNCAVGAVCERASKSTGKIFGGYNFASTPYNGFTLTQGIEGMLYQIGDTKGTFHTASTLKNGTGKSTGAGIFYKVDLGNETFGVTGKIGTSYARSNVDFTAGGKDSEKAWFMPAIGLGMRYNLTKEVALTADWDRLPSKFSGTNSAKTINNVFSVGVAYKF
ncbi:outer membrane beta-barrel protein [Undibacterium flavidum]|uniref:Porin family protein n=1 Tax=Undibacterium flavidum TaxID=2762297 RepID=A0ABR6YE91_9BURK|nr:outer membrane beta-barrel protein [Undibacterium flavidum]MBC3874832.1 porin family protein [Undibacterium flavidum]